MPRVLILLCLLFFLHASSGALSQHPLWIDDEDAPALSKYRSPFFTFANLPEVNYNSQFSIGDRYDIYYLGAPFDTGTTGRPGARFGPHGIREGSRRKNALFGSNVYTKRNPLEEARLADCGDVFMTTLDNTVALKSLEQAHRVISNRSVYSQNMSSTPRIITLGGDHTTTLPALRSIYEHWGQVPVVHFDSHLDTWDPKVIGGYLSDYAGYNHGTVLSWAHSEGLLLNKSIHAGIRGPLANPRDDLDHDRECGFQIITARDIDHIGINGVIGKIKDRIGESLVYISVDIDVLDPAFAPGTGTAEPAGWTTRELLSILDGLEGLRVVGADVVEVAPSYDSPGQITGLAAADIGISLLYLMVVTPIRA